MSNIVRWDLIKALDLRQVNALSVKYFHPMRSLDNNVTKLHQETQLPQ